MTREDIIRMAREAGWDMDDTVDGFSVRLERFAALVAAAEREACEKACEHQPHWRACADAIRARRKQMSDRKVMEQVLEVLEGDPVPLHAINNACALIRTALAQPEQETAAKAWDEGYRQGVEDERISEANIGIAGFGAKVKPARQNPYKTTIPQRKPEQALVIDCPRCGHCCPQSKGDA